MSIMKSIELFVGAGGLGIGLHRAGFFPLIAIEWDQYCCDTIRENQNRRINDVCHWSLVQGDVREIDFRPFQGKVDLVSGGPPCQPFSLGGKHRAHNDTRDMFPQAIRAVRETQPQAFIFENVKGLTRSAFRNYYEYVRLQMEHPEVERRENDSWLDHLAQLERHHTSGSRYGLHYHVVTRVLNSADYGVPQRRERVFFVGFRDDTGVEYCFPEITHSQDALVWSQVRDMKYWERHEIPSKQRVFSEHTVARARRIADRPSLLPWQTIRDAFCDLPDPEYEPEMTLGWQNHRLQPGARSYVGHTGSRLDEPAKTLKAGVHGVPGGENMLCRPDGSVRYFTVRESARLQTFPDCYVFHGSWTETMRQLGNAVPVQLARVVGESVISKLVST